MKELFRSKAFWITFSALAVLAIWGFIQGLLACNQYTMGSTSYRCHEQGFEIAWARGLVISLLIAAIISAIVGISWRIKDMVKSKAFWITLVVLLAAFFIYGLYFDKHIVQYDLYCPDPPCDLPPERPNTIFDGLNWAVIGLIPSTIVALIVAKLWQMFFAKK